MNEKVSKSERLFEEALDLVIRMQDDPGNPVAHDLVARWRARSPDHETAWCEAMEIHGMAGMVMQAKRSGVAGRAMSRRSVLLGGMTGLTVIGAGALLGPQLVLQARADYVTATAELRRVTLRDGSEVTLGADSAIRSRFGDRYRRVELMSGMAFFDVAPDPARPFHVTTGDLVATALGTAFEVSNDAGYLAVSVDHGAVDVRVQAAGMAAQPPVSAGEWMSFDPRKSSFERGVRDVSQIAAWRDGLLVADRDSIASVVARIARWKSGRVVLAQSDFGAERISGVFDLSQPLSALEAVVEPYGGKVRQITPWLTIVSSI
jgi:transmembrane sensor